MNSNTVIREEIVGARNINTFVTMIILFIAGLGFFLAGLSSYLDINLLLLTNTSSITFVPQGIALLFYGTGGIGISIYLFLTIYWNIGSGYNEFIEDESIVRLVRRGFPGKNRTIFLTYDFKNIKSLKFLIKQGLNPRCNILLMLKDKREIPLFPAQFLMSPNETEKRQLNYLTF